MTRVIAFSRLGLDLDFIDPFFFLFSFRIFSIYAHLMIHDIYPDSGKKIKIKKAYMSRSAWRCGPSSTSSTCFLVYICTLHDFTLERR